jgi:hypothetical protein
VTATSPLFTRTTISEVQKVGRVGAAWLCYDLMVMKTAESQRQRESEGM